MQMNEVVSIDKFKNGLRNAGLKYTPQRGLILSTLLAHGSLSNAEVANAVAGKVDRATVYRILAVFEDLKLIHRIWDGWKSKVELSDKFVAHHHHASCRECGQVLRIESDTLEKTLQGVVSQLLFTMDDHTVELRGLCQKCNKKAP